MIRSFKDKRTAAFAAGERIKALDAFARQAQRRLRILDDAERIEDLAQLPSNRFERLKGDRKGQCSIRINEKWRICFQFRNGDAYEVEIVDYH
jgi:proteic killer suppression protein